VLIHPPSHTFQSPYGVTGLRNATREEYAKRLEKVSISLRSNRVAQPLPFFTRIKWGF